MTYRWTIIFTLSATLLIGAFGFAQKKDKNPNPNPDEGDLVQTKSFEVGKGGSLELNTNNGEIHITTWEKDEVFVKVRAMDDEDLDDLVMNSHANTVSVRMRSDNGWGGDMRFDISVPSKFDLDIRTSNGDLDIQGPLVGNITGMTSAGDIHLGNIGGMVDLKTSGGDIRSGNISGDLLLNTSGGDILVGTVSGEADVSTSGGDIKMDDVKKKLRARTSGGNVIVGNVGGEVVISTSGGNVGVGKVAGSARLTTAGGDIDLDGSRGAVKAKTAGGNIRLLDVNGSVEAQTAGGDVEVELMSVGAGTSTLTSASGEIRLYLQDNARATIDARIEVKGRWKANRDEYRISSDFKNGTVDMDESDHAIVGKFTLNGGGEVISLETVNAGIFIRKMRGRGNTTDR